VPSTTSDGGRREASTPGWVGVNRVNYVRPTEGGEAASCATDDGGQQHGEGGVHLDGCGCGAALPAAKEMADGRW
jgi:hypothetical protein